jgi:hypothetical protein
MSQNAFNMNSTPLPSWGYPNTALSNSTVVDPDAKVFTQVDIKGYDSKKIFGDKCLTWCKIQFQGLTLEMKAVDRFVTQRLKHVQKTPYVDTSKSTAELFGLKEIDTLKHRTDIEQLFQKPQAYQQQIQTQSKAMKSAFQAWTKTPQSLASGAKQFLHASFTKPFTNLWAGQEVVSSALSAFASILFAVNVGKKTYDAHESAYNEGQRGGELALTTTGELAKETTKGGLTWMAGSVGAAAIGHTLGTNIGGIKEGSTFARFKTLPTRIAVILGAVLAGATTQAILDWILPSRPMVKKVSLNDIQQEAEQKQAKPS